MFNVSAFNNNGALNSSSFLNMSANRGLNVTINNFIKSMRILTQCKRKSSKKRIRKILGLTRAMRSWRTAPNCTSCFQTKWNKSRRIGRPPKCPT